MKTFKLLSLLFAALVLLTTSCKDDDEGGPGNVTVVSIVADGTSFENGEAVSRDLNGATSAADVALNSKITITFDKAIDPTTVSNMNASISSTTTGDVDADVSVSGMMMTITPTEDLQRGTLYTLDVSGVSATDGGTLAPISRSFTTEGRAPVVVPASQIAYWTFDGTADDATGDYPADKVLALNYGEDRFGQGNSTAVFDGDETIIEIPNAERLMGNNDITISFWMKTNSEDHVDENANPSGHFVMGLGAFFGFQFEIPADFGFAKLAMSYQQEDGTPFSEDLFFPGTPLTEDSWQGWEFHADLTGSGGVEGLIRDQWVHVLCTYDAEEKKGLMYINGMLMKSQDFDLWPMGDPKATTTGVVYQGTEVDVESTLAFGFIKSSDSPIFADTPWGDYYKPTANHFKGSLDDVRIFSESLDAGEVMDLYNAER